KEALVGWSPMERLWKLREETTQLPRLLKRTDRVREGTVELGVTALVVGHVVVRLDDELEVRRSLPRHAVERARGWNSIVRGVHLDRRELARVVLEHVA